MKRFLFIFIIFIIPFKVFAKEADVNFLKIECKAVMWGDTTIELQPMYLRLKTLELLDENKNKLNFSVGSVVGTRVAIFDAYHDMYIDLESGYFFYRAFVAEKHIYSDAYGSCNVSKIQ